ncbi:MAG: hypothetical protein HY719_16325 [Planctomycetes bacterium]|nr:hypothetical protein [Planctomycetota bacterium]
MGEIDTLKERIRLLEAENDRLNTELRNARGTPDFTGAGQMASIAGLEEKVCQLTAEDKIAYINSSMAKHLGVDRKTVMGKPLAEIDHFFWGPGIFTRLLGEARSSGQEASEEVRFEDQESDQTKYFWVRVNVRDNKGQILIEDISETRNLEQTFGKCVAPEIIEQLRSDNFDLARSYRRVVTVLFADLRGFTSTSETMDPQDVKIMIDQYLSRGLKAVRDGGGTIDKLVGDEIMALFGAPLPHTAHVLQSLNVAISMQKAHVKLQEKWRQEGRSAPAIGVGINTGEMVVGGIGSELYFNYTVLGHHVNLGARLCGKAAGGEILVGQGTFEELKREMGEHSDVIQHDFKIKTHPKIEAKGISEPVQVYSIQY